MRLFIGIDLPTETKVVLRNYQHNLQTTGTTGSWKSTDSFHLTLEFLGDLPEESIPAISEILEQAVFRKSRFTLWVEEIDAFPNMEHPHTVWADVKGELEILNLIRNEIHASLLKQGFHVQSSPFTPHITLLSRPKLSQQIPCLKKSPAFLVREIILFESKVIEHQRVYPAIYKADLQE